MRKFDGYSIKFLLPPIGYEAPYPRHSRNNTYEKNEGGAKNKK